MKNETTPMTTPIQKEIAGNTITPPPDLLDRWNTLPCHISTKEIFVMVARWGADQGADRELEACCEWLSVRGCALYGRELRAARRPETPSLKEQALDELTSAERLYPADWSTIRRALEALPND